MPNPTEDNLTTEQLLEPPLTPRQRELLELMSRCTTANYGCASDDAWVGFANELYADKMEENEKHELSAHAIEEDNNGN